MRILVTGGCGFIGHHYVDYVLRHTDWDVVVVDALTYAAVGYDRLRAIGALEHHRVHVFPLDFSYGFGIGVRKEFGGIDYIVHMGAQSHVDRSIRDPLSFVQANVVGTTQVLEFARTQKTLKRMIYFSTDEVFGPADHGSSFNEWDRYNSSNPYAASKAGGEEMCLAYANSYGTPVTITHTMNVFGVRQHPEKFIPLVVRKLLNDETVLIHCDEDGRPCSRHYIHVENVCDAVHTILQEGDVREKYNIASAEEIDNLSLAQLVAEVVGRPLVYELSPQPKGRPGNDVRYCLSSRKLKRLGWSQSLDRFVCFESGIQQTIEWMLGHPEYLVLNGGDTCLSNCQGSCATKCN